LTAVVSSSLFVLFNNFSSTHEYIWKAGWNCRWCKDWEKRTIRTYVTEVVTERCVRSER
jgi:hypothetical protein